MRAVLAITSLLTLVACSGSSTTADDIGIATASAEPAAAAPLSGDPKHPVVVELYQSQGCSSCPPAVRVVNKLADRADVIPLTFSVTYWDDLGWKDTFGDRAYTARQWDYAHFAGRSQVATPQAIVGGRDAVLGSREDELNAAIARNASANGPAISANGGKLTVGEGQPSHATVWIVRYDPRTLNVAVGAGENTGRTIAHRNIVMQLISVGGWSGHSASYTLPAAPAGLKTAVLVQDGKGGPILSAARI